MFDLKQIQKENDRIVREHGYQIDNKTISLTCHNESIYVDPSIIRGYKGTKIPHFKRSNLSLVESLRITKGRVLVVNEIGKTEIELQSTLKLPKDFTESGLMCLSPDIEIFRSSMFSYLHHPLKASVLSVNRLEPEDVLCAAGWYSYDTVIFPRRVSVSANTIKRVIDDMEGCAVENVVILTKYGIKPPLETDVLPDKEELPKKKGLFSLFHRKSPAL